MTVMVDNYVVGTFFASLLGFVLLYILRRNSTTKADKRRHRLSGGEVGEIRNDCVRSSICREGRPERPDTDVIVVGAGVAGAALAHTLGKLLDDIKRFRSIIFKIKLRK